jgi:hypothetical protein
VEEDVLGLNIAVDETVAVDYPECLEKLTEETGCNLLREGRRVLDERIECSSVAVLKDEVDIVLAY